VAGTIPGTRLRGWRCVSYFCSPCVRALTSSRTNVVVDAGTRIIGVGDHANKKDSEKLAALSAVYQLYESGMVCYI
jgi:hypothetical protein